MLPVQPSRSAKEELSNQGWWRRRRREQSVEGEDRAARVIEATGRTEGQEGQSNEQEERNNDTPGPAPAYDPASVIDYMKTLNQQEQGDFLNRVTEGGMGFECRLTNRPTIEQRKEKSV